MICHNYLKLLLSLYLVVVEPIVHLLFALKTCGYCPSACTGLYWTVPVLLQDAQAISEPYNNMHDTIFQNCAIYQHGAQYIHIRASCLKHCHGHCQYIRLKKNHRLRL